MENKDVLLVKLAKGWKCESGKAERHPIRERSGGRDTESTQKRTREERSDSMNCDNRKVVRERRDMEVTAQDREEERQQFSKEKRVCEEQDMGETNNKRRREEMNGASERLCNSVKDSRDSEVAPKEYRGEEQKENSLEDGLKAYEDDIDVLDAESLSSGPSSSSSGSSMSSTPSKSHMPNDSEFKARATRILMGGAMPMCPPALRDWSRVEYSIECPNGVLKWPPFNWQSMSADQKLMAHEYAAIFLEHARRPNFPDLDRRTLLDKYNFMALEGAARPKAETGKPKVDSKLRYYNYEFVLGVVRGTIKKSVVSEGVIASLEKTVRWTDTDYLIEKLDNANIKLRV